MKTRSQRNRNYHYRLRLENKLKYSKNGRWMVHLGSSRWIIIDRCPRKLKKKLKYYGSDFTLQSVIKVKVIKN